MPGKLTIVIGPMFAGKTTELQRRIKRDIHACRRVCIIKYGKDERYSKNNLSTHDQSHIRPTFSVETLAAVGDAWLEYDTIAVDEGQFFPDLVEFCQRAADSGKTVIVSALDGDFLRRPFGKVCDLIPMAEEVVKITAVCMACHERDAHFTRRTVDSTATELIGGAESYIAVCRDCYNTENPPTPGRMNRYKMNVKEVERMTLRGMRSSAEIRPDGSENSNASAPATAAAAAAATMKEPLRRTRDGENQQPGSSQPTNDSRSIVNGCGGGTNNNDNSVQSPMVASPPKMPVMNSSSASALA
jgi:thymidine kinase